MALLITPYNFNASINGIGYLFSNEVKNLVNKMLHKRKTLSVSALDPLLTLRLVLVLYLTMNALPLIQCPTNYKPYKLPSDICVPKYI